MLLSKAKKNTFWRGVIQHDRDKVSYQQQESFFRVAIF